MIKFIDARLAPSTVELLHGLIADQLASTKNWTLSAVERGDLAKAQQLTAEARVLQELYASFNIKVRRDLGREDEKIVA